MANLLSVSGLPFQKKKKEEEGYTPLVNTLSNPFPFKVATTSNNTQPVGNSNSTLVQERRNVDQVNQQAAETLRKQQEARRQNETQQWNKFQQATQKSVQDMQAKGQSSNAFATARAQMLNNMQSRLANVEKNETDKASNAAAKQTATNDAGTNLWRTVGTSLRNADDTRTYDAIDTNDSENIRYFGNQNLLTKVFKPILGNSSDVSKMSYQSVLDAFNSASGDAQADVKKALADEIVDQQMYARQGNQESLKSIDYLNDLSSMLLKYGDNKGKSFGRQIKDWLDTGGFIGNIGSDVLTQFLGNITGRGDRIAAYLQKKQNTRQDLGAIEALDTAASTVGNVALNLATGGTYGMVNASVKGANTLAGLGDKVIDYDDASNAYVRDKDVSGRAGEIGKAALEMAFARLGQKGIGPGLEASAANAATGLPTLTSKDILKYIAKEMPWAAATTYLQAGLENLASGKDWGDMNVGDLAKDFALNVGQDVGMDIFNYGRERAAIKNAILTNDGSFARVNQDGTTTKLSDEELAKAIDDPTSRLADLSYNTTREIRQLGEKAVDYVNRHPLGLTAQRVGDEIRLNGEGTKIDDDTSVKQIRKDIRESLDNNYKNKNNIEMPDSSFANMNKQAVKKFVSGNDIGSLKRLAEMTDDISDLMKLSELVKSEADTKGKHAFANEWEEYVAERIRLNDGKNYDLYTKVAVDGNGNRTLYSQNTKESSLRPVSEQSSYQTGAPDNSIAQTVKGVNPFGEKNIELRSGTDNLNTLARQAEQGNTYAQRRLAELTGQNQDVDTGWRGKSVDEVINPEQANIQTGSPANSYVIERAQRDYTPGIDKVVRAFNDSSNQHVIANRNGVEFSMGEFGENNLQRKAGNDINHGLSESDIASIIRTSDKQSVAGDSSFRKDNVLWFGNLPDGSRGTVITRLNALGQEEVINAYKNNPGYESEMLSKYGTPVQSRTGGSGLEDQSVVSATQGQDVSELSNTIVAQNVNGVNGSVRSEKYADLLEKPYVRQHLNQSIEAALAENPNMKVGDTSIDSDRLLSLYADSLTPEQYVAFNFDEAEGSLFDELHRIEATRVGDQMDAAPVLEANAAVKEQKGTIGSQKATSPEGQTQSERYDTLREMLAERKRTGMNAVNVSPEVATGTTPLSYAEDGTPEFVKRYTNQTTLDGVDNSRQARQSRLKQIMENFKKSNNPIVKKFYELLRGDRTKSVVANLTEAEARRYAAEGGVPIANDAKFVMTQNFAKHEDNDGHLTGIRRYAETETGYQIDANPLTTSDIAMLDSLVKNPDSITNVGSGREGQKLKIEKQINDRYRVIAEVVNDGKELNIVTLYKQNKTPIAGDLPTSQNLGVPGSNGEVKANSPRSETATLSQSIADNVNNVNQNWRNYAAESEDANNNKSSFAENTSKNRNFSNETRGELKNDPLTYKPTTNEERLARANEILSTKSSDEIDNYLRENFFNVKPKNADSADMVLAGEYAKMLDAQGQYDRSTEIINRMSEIGTKQGQNIQALSLMMNRSPEGIANMAQTAIKKSGGKVTGEIRQQIVEKTQEIGKIRGEQAKLSQENADISTKIMNGEGDLSALRKRQTEIAQTFRRNIDAEGRQFSQLGDLVSKNSPDKRSVFGSIWRAGLLSGPRTHTGNLVSNTFQNVLNATSDRFAAGLDWARSKITGNEREVVSSNGGRTEGLKRGLKAAGEVLKTGDNLWEGMDAVTSNSNAWGQGGEMELKNKIANTMMAKPTNFVFRAMSAGDLPFRYSAWENAVRTEAKRQGVNQGLKGQALADYVNSRVATPDPELQAYGIRKGNESVYDVDTALSKAVQAINAKIDGIENPIARKTMQTAETLVMPFVKVPSKVLSTAVGYSPLGSVKAIVSKLGNKNYTIGQFETDLTRSGFGTAAFVGLGYALSAAGLLTGGYPDNKEERNRWKAEGIEPNSIKIGDKYLSLNYLGPASMLMAMGSGVQQRRAKGEDAATIVSGTLMDTLNTFLDQSYVSGINSALNAITDSTRYGESYINSFARSLVPNGLRQIATASDPMQRQINNIKDAIVSGIPVLSQTLDAKVDAYGQEIENKQTLPLGQAWDALKLSNSRETNDVMDEVKRLHEIDPENSDMQVTPPMQASNLSVDGKTVKLTDEQATQLQKDVGEAAVMAMRSVIQSSQYDSLSDEEKAAALNKARESAQTQARKQFKVANDITADNNPGTANSGGVVTENYANKAIRSATSSGTGKNGIEINDTIGQKSKDILNEYNSMTSKDWDKYLYGTSADEAAAEYRLALAKYENDLANGDLNDAQKIKREKTLAKLAVSQNWTKNYRDAYSLAGTKADMQAYLDSLDDETRAETVSILNGLNNAMYDAGIITASTYKTRANAINNTTSSRSGTSKYGGITSAEASAISGLAKTIAKNSTSSGAKTTSAAPSTKRKLRGSSSSGGSGLSKYTSKLAKKATISKA